MPVARPGHKRIYSNTGIERLAAHVAASTAVCRSRPTCPRRCWTRSAMTATTLGSASPAARRRAPVGDLLRFAAELLAPTLITPATLAEATTVQFPGISGIVPGIGRMDPCDWGLGFELKSTKAPHWTGARGTRRRPSATSAGRARSSGSTPSPASPPSASPTGGSTRGRSRRGRRFSDAVLADAATLSLT